MELLLTKYKAEYWACSRDDGDRFWGFIGPHLTSKQFIKEFLGYSVTDEPGQKWIVCVLDGVVIGLAAWIQRKSWTELTCGFVATDHRAKGYFKTMHTLRAKQIGSDMCVRVTAYPTTQKFFADDGFVDVSARGQFKVMEKKQ